MTDDMTREQVVDIIATAHSKGERPDLSDLDLSDMDLSYLDLSGVDLSGSNMSYSNLARANLRGTDLAHTNLHCANLAYSNLRSSILTRANLSYADLSSAILTNAILYHANLTGVKMCGLFLKGLPSGRLSFIPTPEGWHLAIGCWEGTVDELRVMIAEDHGWPEARGEEIAMRRPVLKAMAATCEAFAATNHHALADVRATADQWEKTND